jgi:two-component system, OmpR family, KDP operon response regulator KdpE
MDATNSERILVVEDDEPIRKFLRNCLSGEGYSVIEAATGAQALRLAGQQPPDVVILDLGLPDQDGQAVLVALRDWFSGPILILSAREQEAQKIQALDAGADDYLSKPFGSGELLARIRAALRRVSSASVNADSTVFATGDLHVDLATRKIVVRGSEVHLTPIEYKLLTTLIRHTGKVLTHRFLLKEVWGPSNADETHYLRVHMAALRRKLERDSANPQFLLTEQGVGYRLALQSET